MEHEQVERITDSMDHRASVWALCTGPDGKQRIHASLGIPAHSERHLTAELKRDGWRFIMDGKTPRWLCPECARQYAQREQEPA